MMNSVIGGSVKHVDIPEFDAVLVYADADGQVSADGYPQLYHVIRDLHLCRGYNRIVASHVDGFLYLAIAQGPDLKLANVFPAEKFSTAEYFIFMAMKQIQMNPEVSTIYWRHRLDVEDEMSLYRYFKSVAYLLCG